MQNFINHPLTRGVVALFSGAMLPFAFAPFGFYWVAELSLVLLLFVWHKASPKLAFWYGWLFGGTFFGGGVYWVYISIHRYGNAPLILAIAMVVLLVAFLALYPAFQGYLLQRLCPENNWHKFLLAFPASYVLLEWIRGWLLSGFPWLFLGYGHIDSPLRGFASILGVYGVSFLIAQTAGALFYICWARKNKKLAVFFGLFIIFLWGSGTKLAKINWTKPLQGPIEASVIQGKISQERKWNPQELAAILNSYILLTSNNLTSKIIVWPEAAIPTYFEHAAPYLEPLLTLAKKNNITILSGIPCYDKQYDRYYNGIVALGADSGQYYKRQLVAFGEYLPLKSMLRWLHNFLIIPMSDFSRGARYQPALLAQGVLLAPFICYEIAYHNLVLDYLPQAGLLITVCDDSWFGESVAAYQHLEIARMRSVEVGRYQLLSTNAGVSAIIDPTGKVTTNIIPFQQTVLTAKVQNFTGSTPWVAWGKYVWLPLCLVGLGWAKYFGSKQTKEQQ